MDGKMLNSHGVDFLDGSLGLDLDEKDLDEEETRRDMAKILKELKQKHPDKEVGIKASGCFVMREAAVELPIRLSKWSQKSKYGLFNLLMFLRCF